MNKDSSLQIEGSFLYTPAQKLIRDNTVWTKVQAILAPIQFFVCLVSIILVLRYLLTDEGYYLATLSIIFKTSILLLIMFTGAIWEKVVFGQYLLAPAFFWEDIVSFFVIFFHLAYLVALFSGKINPESLMLFALSAYFLYLVNALQFLRKLRLARKSSANEIALGQEGILE
jgi:3-vinyl bacteriochlorophyllide hydratase